VRNLEWLVEELVYHQVLTGRVAVWVGYRDGRAGEGRAGLPVPTNRFDGLLDTFRPCLRSAWLPRTLASRMHLFAEELTPDSPRQLRWFDREAEDAATAVKQAINQKHGRFALRSAATLPLAPIYVDGANGYDICDVHGKMCF
jgi:DNA polymerase V